MGWLTVGLVLPAALAAQPSDRIASAKIHPALRGQLPSPDGRVKTWVFFTDKGVSSPDDIKTAVGQVAATYNPRAAERRLLRGQAAKEGRGLFEERDLSVCPAYVEAISAIGVRPLVTSRWLNAVSVLATREQVDRIAALPFVTHLQPVAKSSRVEPHGLKTLAPPGPRDGGRPRDPLDYGLSTAQLTQINLLALHDQGYTGGGVIVGILDTGFHREHVAFNNPDHPLNVVAEWDFIHNDGNTDIEEGDDGGQHSHGTLILGCLGAYQPAELVGGAFDASFILCKTEDITQEVPAEEDNYVAGLEFIEAHGGDMTTSSLGYIDWYTQADLDGQTAVTTIAVNTASFFGLHCCTAAGNEGHDGDPETSHLIAPADALKVLTSGAADLDGVMAGFSSDGPTADGRVKPELLARGVNTYTVSPWGSTDYTTASGTSLSTPLLACAVACLTQAHPDWTVEEMRAALFQTAGDYVAYGTYDPLYVRGYGLVNAFAAAQDCNDNNVPDSVDIAQGTSQDCQPNGIPDECEIIPGDLNCDCAVDIADVGPFVLALIDPAAYAAEYPNCPIARADANADTQLDGRDVQAFVELLLP